MNTTSAIQFYGIDGVYNAVDNRQCPAWGIWQSRQFLFKYEGDSMEASLQLLQRTLEILAESGSTATYTIKFFEPEGNKAIKIKENTPCDGSFNFKTFDAETNEQRKLTYSQNSTVQQKKIEELEQKIALLEMGGLEDEEEPETDLQGALIGLIQEPAKINQLIDAFRGLVGMFNGQQMQPAAVGNVNRVGQNSPIEAPAGSPGMQQMAQDAAGESYEQKMQRLGNAVDILEQHDSKVVEHFEKLARLAQTNPQQFQSLLSMLDMMP